jgi:hypothetical protein
MEAPLERILESGRDRSQDRSCDHHGDGIRWPWRYFRRFPKEVQVVFGLSSAFAAARFFCLSSRLAAER